MTEIDMSPMIERLVVRDGWTRRKAKIVSEFYKNFLYLKKKYGEQYDLSPTLQIDAFWHEHILDSAKYMRDCEVYFGYYLHHWPVAPDEPVEIGRAQLEKMLELHLAEFGYEIYDVVYSYADLKDDLKKRIMSMMITGRKKWLGLNHSF